MRVMVLAASAVIAMGAFTAREAVSQSVMERQCPKGERADEYAHWKLIENNAVRIADEYAMNRNPMATFVFAEVEPVFQVAGEYAGRYLVKLVAHGPSGISFAMLLPNFPFCEDPSTLDDSRSDLFTVVNAKFNGRPF